MEKSHDERSDGQLALSDFFTELERRLQSVKDLERKSDRDHAHRFNFLDYLRTDELGLSRIIADLLDPHARHGQGPLFLKTLLEMLQPTIKPWPDLDVAGARVNQEQVIEKQRRIDIEVRIPDGNGAPYRLAIENKPYAGDQNRQVVDYLEHLKKKEEDGGGFVLIYLSSDGHPPSEESLSETGLQEWRDRFVIMPYDDQSYGKEVDDRFKDFRTDFALTTWLSTCREKCSVERLRWFLDDAEKYCQRTFGDHQMASDNETLQVIDFLHSNPDHFDAAWAVRNSWPDVADEVCERFLRHLCDSIQQKANEEFPKLPGGPVVSYVYERKSTRKTWRHGVSLSGRCWRRYSNPAEQGCAQTSIKLNNQGNGPWAWGIGVCSPTERENMSPEDRERRDRIRTELESKFKHGRSTAWWPRWKAVQLDDEMTYWWPLVPKLHRECKSGGGKVTDYFVEKFIEVACQAIPVINKIEGERE